MSMIKRLWKRGTRKHQHQHQHQHYQDAAGLGIGGSSSSLASLGAAAASAAPSGAGDRRRPSAAADSAATNDNHNHDAGTSPAEAEATAQQEALIAALQSTVLEQRQRIKDLDAAVDQLHGDARRQAFHVEALQRLLRQLAGPAPGEEEQEGNDVEGADGGGGRGSRLAPTPAPPMWGSSSGGSSSRRPEEEASGLYSYITAFLGSAASSFLPSEEAAAAAGGAEDDGRAQRVAIAESGGADGRGEGQTMEKREEEGAVVAAATTVVLPPSGRQSRMELEDAQALLMGQILEKLHLAEDRYHFQAEEIHALQQQLREREQDCARLRAERARHALLLHGLKRELAAHRHKLRDRDVKEASLAVELDRYRLEKRLSMTRLLSEAAAGGSGGELPMGPLTLPPPTPSSSAAAFGFGGAQGQGGPPGSAPASYSLAPLGAAGEAGDGFIMGHSELSSPSRFSLPPHAEAFPLEGAASPTPHHHHYHTQQQQQLQQLDRMIGDAGSGGGGGGAPAAPSPVAGRLASPPVFGPPHPAPGSASAASSLRGSSLGAGLGLGMGFGTPVPMPAEGQQATVGQLRVEVAALAAELEAARAVSEQEVRRRVAAEHEAGGLKARLAEAEAQLQELLSAAPARLRGGRSSAASVVAEGKAAAAAAAAGSESEGEGGSDGEEGEEEEEEGVAALVLKEQLSGLRDLAPAFHATYGPAATEFKVRGPTYLTDGVKVTDPAGPSPLLELVHMELLDVSTLPPGSNPSTTGRADHVTALFAAHGADGPHARCRALAAVPPPFLLILNFQVPGNPPCSMMAYFALGGARRRRLERLCARLRREKEKAQAERGLARGEAKASATTGGGLVEDDDDDDDEAGGGGFVPPRPRPTPVSAAAAAAAAAKDDEEEDDEGDEEEVDPREEKSLRLLAAFLEGDDAYRNARFKLIPSVVEGPFLIRMSVGNKPVLLGTKLTQRYWSGPGYLEVGIDIGSSSVASSVLGLVRDYSKNIVVEIAVLVQGESEAELPERILGSVRCSRLDWALAESLGGRLVPSPPASGASSSSLSRQGE